MDIRAWAAHVEQRQRRGHDGRYRVLAAQPGAAARARRGGRRERQRSGAEPGRWAGGRGPARHPPRPLAAPRALQRGHVGLHPLPLPPRPRGRGAWGAGAGAGLAGSLDAEAGCTKGGRDRVLGAGALERCVARRRARRAGAEEGPSRILHLAPAVTRSHLTPAPAGPAPSPLPGPPAAPPSRRPRGVVTPGSRDAGSGAGGAPAARRRMMCRGGRGADGFLARARGRGGARCSWSVQGQKRARSHKVGLADARAQAVPRLAARVDLAGRLRGGGGGCGGRGGRIGAGRPPGCAAHGAGAQPPGTHVNPLTVMTTGMGMYTCGAGGRGQGGGAGVEL
jgi:hypothetical protein